VKKVSFVLFTFLIFVLGIAILLGLRIRFVTTLRATRALQGIKGLQNESLRWKGDILVVSGTVPDYRTYELVSHRVSKIVGANYLVNEVIVPTHDEVEQQNKPMGTITIAVDTAYDDSDRSVKQVKAIVDLPQFEVYAATADQTLSSIILDRYRLGMSDLPRTFTILEQRIQELNGLSNPDTIKNGLLRIPVLPPRVQTLPVSGALPHGGFGSYGVVGSVAGYLGPCIINVGGACAGSVAPSSAIRAVEDPTYVLSLPVTAGNVSDVQSSLAAFPSVVKSAKMTIDLAASSSTATELHKTLKTQESTLLISTLQAQPRRKATVFILDDGWPDKDVYSKSIVELQSISDAIRDQFGMPHINLKALDFVEPNGSTPHSSHIRDSLQEFTERDKTNVVKVVYIPLSKAQNSTSILSELLRLYFIVKMETLPTATPTATSDLMKEAADKWTAEVLASIQDKYSDQHISTDWAIIEAVWTLADVVAFRSPGRDVFFINESWTVLPNTVSETHAGVSAGVVVAAVGNTPGKVVNSDTGGLDFARQCTSTRSVIAVLNVQPQQGLVCGSSKVNDELLDDTFVSAYDGEVQSGPNERGCLDGDTDKCVCGSSFSAPRIAWMLALSEAMRTSDREYTSWNVVLENKLRSLRTVSATPWSGEYLHLSDLLQAR
jgi:hypothetical protein